MCKALPIRVFKRSNLFLVAMLYIVLKIILSHESQFMRENDAFQELANQAVTRTLEEENRKTEEAEGWNMIGTRTFKLRYTGFFTCAKS